MPIKSLPEVHAGSRVMVDANVFVYAVNGTSRQCAEFLRRCASGDVRGVTTFEALAEVNHRLMLEEALAAGLVQRGASAQLRRAHRSIPGLKEYWPLLTRFLDMSLVLLELDEPRFRHAQLMRERHALLTNDSLLLAAADSYGITSFATRDDDFDDVAWLTVYKPGDIP